MTPLLMYIGTSGMAKIINRTAALSTINFTVLKAEHMVHNQSAYPLIDFSVAGNIQMSGVD